MNSASQIAILFFKRLNPVMQILQSLFCSQGELLDDLEHTKQAENDYQGGYLFEDTPQKYLQKYVYDKTGNDDRGIQAVKRGFEVASGNSQHLFAQVL